MSFNNPFDVLNGLKARLPKPEPDVQSRAEPSPVAPPQTKGPTIPRAVVRMERSGRGGKTVTVVEHLEIKPTERDVWLKALKAALGCGGSVEGETLVFQGDHRKRLPALLTAKGVKRVTIG